MFLRPTLRFSLLPLLALSLLAAPLKADEAEEVAMDMVEAWNAVDLDRVISLFTPDGVLHSMMTDPIVGREQLRHHLQPLFDGIDELELNLRRVVVDGDTVFIERVDEFVFNGKRGAVPVVGVLEIRDGAVAEWREYYDRAQLYGEMGIPVPDRNAAAASTHQSE
jgi:limonene-1,2-epoxide hydrolase